MGRGRKPLDNPTTKVTINLRVDLNDRLNHLLKDPATGRTGWGYKRTYIENLIVRDLKARGLYKEAEQPEMGGLLKQGFDSDEPEEDN